jgi:hypothetical protein
MRTFDPSELFAVTTIDALRRRPLQRGIAKPVIVSVPRTHGQEKVVEAISKIRPTTGRTGILEMASFSCDVSLAAGER